MSAELAGKLARLLEILGEMPGVAVAFSGGVDSAVVCRAAKEALGERALAITADSPSVPRSEIALAQATAERIGIRHLLVRTHEFDNPDYLRNDGSRCYFCKSELYSRIEAELPKLGLSIVLSGANRDDMGDYRPGLTAAAEHQVRHPLMEADLGKAEIRQLARHWGLAVWDKPASPCLSSRLAPGLEVTPERTERIERAEQWLRQHGLRDCRVRYHHGDLARVEVPVEEIGRLATEPIRSELTRYFQNLGFKFVSLDLVGLQSGGLNQLVSLEVRQRFEQVGNSASAQ